MTDQAKENARAWLPIILQVMVLVVTATVVVSEVRSTTKGLDKSITALATTVSELSVTLRNNRERIVRLETLEGIKHGK